jgi:hypothetical protein
MGIPEYTKVTYNNKHYCVGKIQFKDVDKLFVIDFDKHKKIIKYEI